MNQRLQKYKKNRLLGMNMLNAARAAGYSESYCLARASKLEKSVKIGMEDAFEREGLTDKAIVKIAIEGLEATKLYGKDAEEHPDWMARHRYLETILKLTNTISDSDGKVSNDVKVYVVNNADIQDREKRASDQRDAVLGQTRISLEQSSKVSAS